MRTTRRGALSGKETGRRSERGCGMTRTRASIRASAKKSELLTAKRRGGQRHPSMGVEHKDISAPGMAIEHKKRESMPLWFLKAFDQARVNATLYPGEMPLVIFAYHQGRGHPIRRFYCLEEDQWELWNGTAPVALDGESD